MLGLASLPYMSLHSIVCHALPNSVVLLFTDIICVNNLFVHSIHSLPPSPTISASPYTNCSYYSLLSVQCSPSWLVESTILGDDSGPGPALVNALTATSYSVAGVRPLTSYCSTPELSDHKHPRTLAKLRGKLY